MTQQDYKKYYGKVNWAEPQPPEKLKIGDPMVPWILLACVVVWIGVVWWSWWNKKRGGK
jgi:hypothetical protein